MTVSQLAQELRQAMENQNVPADAPAEFWDGSQTHAIRVLIARHRTGDKIWIETVNRYQLTKALLDICLVRPNWGEGESDPREAKTVWFEVSQQMLKIAREALRGTEQTFGESPSTSSADWDSALREGLASALEAAWAKAQRPPTSGPPATDLAGSPDSTLKELSIEFKDRDA